MGGVGPGDGVGGTGLGARGQGDGGEAGPEKGHGNLVALQAGAGQQVCLLCCHSVNRACQTGGGCGEVYTGGATDEPQKECLVWRRARP